MTIPSEQEPSLASDAPTGDMGNGSQTPTASSQPPSGVSQPSTAGAPATTIEGTNAKRETIVSLEIIASLERLAGKPTNTQFADPYANVPPEQLAAARRTHVMVLRIAIALAATGQKPDWDRTGMPRYPRRRFNQRR